MYGFSDQEKAIPRTRLSADLQGSSRYSARTPESIEHMFDIAELSDGVRRVTFPLPTKPWHVHGYLLAGDGGWLLVDTGLALPDLEEHAAGLGVQLAGIVVTHFHPDHVGGADQFRAATGAPVLQGELDYAQCVHVWGNPRWPERMAAWFAEHGVPREITDDLIEVGSAYAAFIRFARDPQPLRPGDRVGGWEVVALPGHADGHIGLLRDGALVAGDHLLPRITPAVGLYPDSRPDPLGDYLESLARTRELAPAVVYPGHGDPIDDPARRADELVEHHRRRLDETLAALGPQPRSAYEASLDVFGADLSPAARRFAVAETLSHLVRLAEEGRAERVGGEAGVAWRAP
jgi:glyoxylase-like metal-dependent hydrolase (beta-lactamase superfamily II)